MSKPTIRPKRNSISKILKHEVNGKRYTNPVKSLARKKRRPCSNLVLCAQNLHLKSV